MKTSYELAMERLNKSTPHAKMKPAQKKDLAELDSKYAAKIAEREIAMKGDIESSAASGDFEKMEQLKQQLVKERKALQVELEEKKEKVRVGKG